MLTLKALPPWDGEYLNSAPSLHPHCHHSGPRTTTASFQHGPVASGFLSHPLLSFLQTAGISVKFKLITSTAVQNPSLVFFNSKPLDLPEAAWPALLTLLPLPIPFYLPSENHGPSALFLSPPRNRALPAPLSRIFLKPSQAESLPPGPISAIT